PPLPSSISLLTRRPPASPLLPYTTLFRSPLRLRFRLASRCRDISHSPQRLDGGRGDHVGGESPVLEGVRVPSQVDRLERLIRTVDRKSTRLNSSHVKISYAVFCLKKKTET